MSYTADDREPGEFPTDTTAEVAGLGPQARFEESKGGTISPAALKGLWAERDLMYAKREKYLTDDQIEAARSYRYREAIAAEDPTLLNIVDSWYPPEHGQ